MVIVKALGSYKVKGKDLTKSYNLILGNVYDIPEEDYDVFITLNVNMIERQDSITPNTTKLKKKQLTGEKSSEIKE